MYLVLQVDTTFHMIYKTNYVTTNFVSTFLLYAKSSIKFELQTQ